MPAADAEPAVAPQRKAPEPRKGRRRFEVDDPSQGVARRFASQGAARRGPSTGSTPVVDTDADAPAAAHAPSGRQAPEEAWEPEQWVDEGELREEAAGAVGRGGTTAPVARARGRRRWSPNDDLRDDDDADAARRTGTGSGVDDDPGSRTAEELRKALGPQRGARAEARLREAGNDFRRERYEDARKLLRPLADQAPGAASVRELFGLTLYRLGRWAPARRELEAFRDLTGSVEQHPVLADCYRALGRYTEVEELWDELRAASPSAELVAEGRIVAAGALADQGRLPDAIALLQAGIHPTKRAKPHHLRMTYALADLYERAGDAPRARELFRRVAASDEGFVDVQARIRALR